MDHARLAPALATQSPQQGMHEVSDILVKASSVDPYDNPRIREEDLVPLEGAHIFIPAYASDNCAANTKGATKAESDFEFAIWQLAVPGFELQGWHC